LTGDGHQEQTSKIPKSGPEIHKGGGKTSPGIERPVGRELIGGIGKEKLERKGRGKEKKKKRYSRGKMSACHTSV